MNNRQPKDMTLAELYTIRARKDLLRARIQNGFYIAMYFALLAINLWIWWLWR